MPERLPVEDCLPDLITAIQSQRPVILRAPPGAGKTTGVPPALLRSGCVPEGKILLLQPRRIAARAAAHRLSHLADEPVGRTYGYHVRFDRKLSKQTRVISMTTGILLRQMTDDPLLDDVGCVILDEFHERSLELDLALGMLERVRASLREDLRLIVMSATLETKPIERLIPGSVTIESLGRAFDVDVAYDETLERKRQTRDEIARSVAAKLPDALTQSDGDILAFLPGVAEIHRAAEMIGDLAAAHSIQVCKLYGDLSPAEQDAVLTMSDRRKVVLATNVAETSITIPGITCVIDTGLARSLRYDTSVGISSLQLGPISKASADQRAGRAGRTAPGVCFRLWPRALQRSRPDHTPPEVASADLSSALLMLAAWAERDVFQFPWVTTPTRHAVESAHNLLVLLGAVDDSLQLTELGTRMNALPLHPRLARLMLSAQQHRCAHEASIAAALLSERDPFDRDVDIRATSQISVESDLIDRVVRLKRFFDGASDSAIHRGAAKQIKRVSQALQRASGLDSSTPPEESSSDLEESLTRSLLAAFPDRLAKRRVSDSSSGLMVGARGVRLDRSSSVRTSEYFLCINVDGQGDESRVRLASGVERNWLPAEHLRLAREVFFDEARQAIIARDRTCFLDLVIDESPAECPSDASTAALLFEHAQRQIESVLPAKDQQLQGFLARWRFLAEHLGDSNEARADHLPSTVDVALANVLKEFCRTRTSFKELSAAPWLDHLKGSFSYEQLQWFQQQAPESMEVPSGNRIRLSYAAGKPPVLAVRIQEVFGWAKTPRLAGGAVPVQLHLLGPNHRPQQITDDLESFWQTTYSEVRKELKRRYSKHHWPDDPWSATATRNGLKPKR